MGVLEQHRGGRPLVVGLIALGVALGGLSLWWHVRHAGPAAVAARPVPGARIHLAVEVLNTTNTVGLARTATRRLRDAGIDVVYYGTDTGAAVDSTQVLVRRGTGRDASAVVRVLGVGQVRALPDSSRMVDLTVRLGRDFAARLAAGHP